MDELIYSRQDLIDIIESLLEMPDIVIDAIQNENTNYSASDLLDIAESGLNI